MASVYVFNTMLESISLVLNNEPIGSIEGISPANGYALEPSQIPLTAGSNPGQFGSQNQLQVELPGAQVGYQFQIGSSGTDCQLFIFGSNVVLSSPTGQQIFNPGGQGFPTG